MFVTKRQKAVLDYISAYIAKHGYAPTIEEMRAHFRLHSLATVHKHLSNLERKGLIRRTWNHSRAIELTRQPAAGAAVDLPLLGRVAAGAPIEALETADQITVPESFVRRRHTYALRVVGNSMVEDGILDGDHLVVEERAAANNGETVIAVDSPTETKRA